MSFLPGTVFAIFHFLPKGQHIPVNEKCVHYNLQCTCITTFDLEDWKTFKLYGADPGKNSAQDPNNILIGS